MYELQLSLLSPRGLEVMTKSMVCVCVCVGGGGYGRYLYVPS